MQNGEDAVSSHGWGATRRLWAHVAVSTVLCGALAWMSFDRPHYFNVTAEQFGPMERATLALILLGFLANYAVLVLWREPEAERPPSVRWIIAAVVPMCVILLISPPLMSLDATAYVLSARNWVHHGLNPYVTPLNAVPDDPWMRQMGHGAWWVSSPAAYGPLFCLLCAPWVLLGSRSILLAIYLYKIFSFALFVASIPVFHRIVRALKLPDRTTMLYAMNPALLLHVMLDGHNDMLMALATILALYMVMREKWGTGALWVGLSTAVKYYSVVLLPMVVFERGRLHVLRGVVAGAIVGSVMLATSAPLGFPFRIILDGFRRSESFEPLYRPVPTIAAFDAIFGAHSQMAIGIATLLGYGLIIYLTLYRRDSPVKFAFWSMTTVLLMTVRHFGAWYLVAVFPAGALLAGESTGYGIGLIALTYYSLFHFFGV